MKLLNCYYLGFEEFSNETHTLQEWYCRFKMLHIKCLYNLLSSYTSWIESFLFKIQNIIELNEVG